MISRSDSPPTADALEAAKTDSSLPPSADAVEAAKPFYLAQPISVDASNQLAVATVFTRAWLEGHEDDETCVLPVDHVQTLLRIADEVMSLHFRHIARAALSTPGDANGQ